MSPIWTIAGYVAGLVMGLAAIQYVIGGERWALALLIVAAAYWVVIWVMHAIERGPRSRDD